MNILSEIRGLSVTYRGQKAPALEKIDLDIHAGSRLAIIGESGSGKSTLARTLAGLLPPGSKVEGNIRWAEGKPPAPGRDLGFVFQDPSSSLNPVLTIGEQVAEGARKHLGLSWKAAHAHAVEMLERVRIPLPEKAIDAFPHQLSGGQRQRVAIAAALAARPRILIADEATSALDMVVQAEIVSLLDELVRDADLTLIFITHDIAIVRAIADSVAVMHRGRLVRFGPKSQALSPPFDDYTDLLLKSVPEMEIGWLERVLTTRRRESAGN